MSSGCETSFHTYTFSYQWTVNHLRARLYHPCQLLSPKFDSPEGAKPATKWGLVLIKEVQGRQSSQSSAASTNGLDESNVSLRLERLRCVKTQATQVKGAVVTLPMEQPHKESEIWVEAHLKTIIAYRENKESVASQSKGPTNVSPPRYSPVVSFNRCLSTSKLLDSLSVTFDCEVKVWILDKPIHVHQPIHVPEFNLGKLMEENRRKNLFTDITLVAADKKEFKAHKAILAARSNFFETRFSSRWQEQNTSESSGKVELTDVPGTVMEVMLSYMYTGEVAAIEKVAISVLPFAEEYGLEGLKKMCEQSLAKSLTSDNAVDLLITANAHNALDLKKVCMDYISSNVVSVKKSEGWRKLKERQDCHDLCIELLEKITEKS